MSRWIELGAAILAASALASGCSSRPARLCDDVDCSGHGDCVSDGDRAVCVCVNGFVPQELTCATNTGCTGVSCSGHGDCVEESGRAEGCACDPGYVPSSDGFHCRVEASSPDAGLCADEDGDGVSLCDGDCDDRDPAIRRCDCLAVGNNGVDRVYSRSSGGGALSLAWTSEELHNTTAVAWADVDGDNLDDLAVGTAGGLHLMVYSNTGSGLEHEWESEELDATQAVAWARWPAGDAERLYLAAAGHDALGTGETIRVYQVDGSGLHLTWSSSGAGDACAVAWGDWDDDGDPDLAVGMCAGLTGAEEHPNVLYRNDDGAFTEVWRDSSRASDDTRAVAWADVDGDGTVELAVGNSAEDGGVENRFFQWAPEGLAEMSWSTRRGDTFGLAWGDWDGDGEPDLAVANDGDGTENRIYEAGGTNLALVWSSDDSDRSRAVAWGNLDRDGTMELAVGNTRGPNRLYDRTTAGDTVPVWTSAEEDSTRSIAWGHCGF